MNELLDRIISGQLPQLSTLPNEPMLCEAFGVSRTVIREAVKVLEEKGLLHAKQGQGTTVAAVDDWNLLDPMVLAASVRHDRELRILDDIVDVRRVLEAQMARQAATTADDAAVAELAALLGQLAEQVVTPSQYILTDVAFHDAVMRASGNQLARAVVSTIHSEARASNRYNGQPQPRDCAVSYAGHTAIYERIAARDPEGAAQAMSNHILNSWRSRRNPGPVGTSQEQSHPLRLAEGTGGHAGRPRSVGGCQSPQPHRSWVTPEELLLTSPLPLRSSIE